jgi:iron complex transport system substrate-binding protein
MTRVILKNFLPGSVRGNTMALLVFLIFLSVLPLASAQERYPERIISLAPNITEILFALNLGSRVVGVTSFCDFPDDAKHMPKIGGMSNPSLEAVVSLKPDMVVLTTDGNPKAFEERLNSLKIRTYVFRARTLSELPQGIRDMGCALGTRQTADHLAERLEVSLKKAAAMGRGIQETGQGPSPHMWGKKKILFIVWPEPLIAAGPGTIADDAIALLGHINIAAVSGIAYPKYSVEEIMRERPDIIFIGKGHTQIRRASAGLLKKISSVPAVLEEKVFFLSDRLYRLGPRVVEGIEEMSRCLQ